jgi:hypothetical protein
MLCAVRTRVSVRGPITHDSDFRCYSPLSGHPQATSILSILIPIESCRRLQRFQRSRAGRLAVGSKILTHIKEDSLSLARTHPQLDDASHRAILAEPSKDEGPRPTRPCPTRPTHRHWGLSRRELGYCTAFDPLPAGFQASSFGEPSSIQQSVLFSAVQAASQENVADAEAGVSGGPDALRLDNSVRDRAAGGHGGSSCGLALRV